MNVSADKSDVRLPFGDVFGISLAAALGPRQTARVTASNRIVVQTGAPSELPVQGSDLASILGGARVVAARNEAENVQPNTIPVSALRYGLQGEPALGYAPEPTPPMPVDTGAIAPAPSQYPVQEEPPCFNVEPRQAADDEYRARLKMTKGCPARR